MPKSLHDGVRDELHVLKFGGSSLENVERIGTVVEIISERSASATVIAVVSALGGVTNDLVKVAEQAALRRPEYERVYKEVGERHTRIIDDLVLEQERAAVAGVLEGYLADLENLLHGISLVRECTPRTLDSIVSFGELMSSNLVAAALRRAGIEARACDARQFVVTDATFGNARVNSELTAERVRRYFEDSSGIDVVTGFVAATERGETTTLGRGGSDYTAGLVGAVVSATEVEIWTDVDGVMSADPRLVANAFSLSSLSYEELIELSHFGAKVIHASAVHPARQLSIPVTIRNTLNPQHPGTRVTDSAVRREGYPLRGISSIDDVVLLRLEGAGMVGNPAISARLFATLARADISPILISQASSAHSISFALEPQLLARAMQDIGNEFELERQANLINELTVEKDLSIIATVGKGMRSTVGLAGRVFRVLGDHGVNVHAIAQGSSELNISLVVERHDSALAVQAIHDAFFSRPDRPPTNSKADHEEVQSS